MCKNSDVLPNNKEDGYRQIVHKYWGKEGIFKKCLESTSKKYVCYIQIGEGGGK